MLRAVEKMLTQSGIPVSCTFKSGERIGLRAGVTVGSPRVAVGRPRGKVSLPGMQQHSDGTGQPATEEEAEHEGT